MYTVKLTEYAKSDYEKLDGSQKHLILKGLKRISERDKSQVYKDTVKRITDD